MSTLTLTTNQIADILKKLGVQEMNSGVSTGANWMKGEGELLESFSPVDGALIGSVRGASRAEYDKAIATAQKGFEEWRTWPAPKRGEVVRSWAKNCANTRPT